MILEEAEEIADPEQELRRYLVTKDAKLRNRLTLHYLYIARSLAYQLRGIAPGFAQEEDLINQGVLALMDCLDRYDDTKGARFETYAFLRVRGAMIDYIRSQDWVPHRTRSLQKKVDEAYHTLASRKMREPDTEELAAYLGISKEQVETHMASISKASVLSFEAVLQDCSGVMAKEELESGDDSIKPQESLLQKEMTQMLGRAIESLPEKERLVVTLYYYEELKYSEISEVIGVGESRVCQLHARALNKMKQSLEEYMRG